jgi:ferredoxin
MAARTVVVKRPRRRLFSILWQLPHWLRAVASASPRHPPPLAAAALGMDMRPGLVWTADGGHRCVGCGRCIDVCPGRALALEREEESQQAERTVRTRQRAPAARGSVPSSAAGVRRFELAPGRCIACGLCVELCPESALVRVAGATLVGPGPEPRRWSLIDLLQAAPS